MVGQAGIEPTAPTVAGPSNGLSHIAAATFLSDGVRSLCCVSSISGPTHHVVYIEKLSAHRLVLEVSVPHPLYTTAAPRLERVTSTRLAGQVGYPTRREVDESPAWTVLGMPRSDLTAQRSIPLLDAPDFAKPHIPDIQSCTSILYNQIVCRVHFAPENDLALVVVRFFQFFGIVSHWRSFQFERVPARAMAQNPDGLRSFPPSDNTRRGSHSGHWAMEEGAGFEPGSSRCANERTTGSASLP